MSLRSRVNIDIKFEITNKDTRREVDELIHVVELYLNARNYRLQDVHVNKVTCNGKIKAVYEVNGESDDENTDTEEQFRALQTMPPLSDE